MQEFLVAMFSVIYSSINCSKKKLKLCDLENFTNSGKSAPLVFLVDKKTKPNTNLHLIKHIAIYRQ
jgi:hypothetical protein